MSTPHEHPPHTRGQTIHWARGYDWLMSVMALGRPDRFAAAVADQAQLQPSMSVLDVGCGTGRLAVRLKQTVGEGGEVHGIDPSPEMVERARYNARRKGVDLDLALGVAEQLSFDDATFDRVVSTLVFHHLPDDLKEAALREILRVLKPGGRLVIGDFEPGSRPWLHRALGRVFRLFGHGHDHHAHGHDRPLAQLLREAGFAEVDLVPSGAAHIEFTLGAKPA